MRTSPRFDTKIDDALDKLVGDKSNGNLLYSRDLKPWFSGQVRRRATAAAATMLPNGSPAPGESPAASASGMPGGMPRDGLDGRSLSDLHFVVGIGVKDRARLDTLIETARSMASDLTFTDQPNGDRTIVVGFRQRHAARARTSSPTSLLLAPSSADDLVTSLSVRGRLDARRWPPIRSSWRQCRRCPPTDWAPCISDRPTTRPSTRP